MIHTFFADIYGMASLGVLIRQKLKLLLRFLIKGRIHFIGMQSLKYKGPIPIPSRTNGTGPYEQGRVLRAAGTGF